MAAFRKRNGKQIEINYTEGTYMRVLLVRAGQLIGDAEDVKRGISLQVFVDEYLEQRIDEDFREIYGMSFDEFAGKHRTITRLIKKPSHAHKLAVAELGDARCSVR